MDTSVSTPQAVATVISVEGQAFARDPAGQMRPIKPGDVLREGDSIVTMPGGQVQLAFLDGHMLTLLPNETFQFSAETSPTSRPDVAEASLPAGEADRIIQALERGENIDDVLGPTAAGFNAGNDNAGNDFVRLLRVVEGVSSQDFQFGAGASRAGLSQQEDNDALGGLPASNTFNFAPVAADVAVAGQNDAPVAAADTLAATEDTPVTYTAAQLLGNDSDVDSNPLTIAAVTSGANGVAVLNPDGTVTFTPNAHFNGVAGFSYTATDGSLLSNAASVTVNVAAVNDAPVNTVPAAQTTAEDTPKAITGLFISDADAGSSSMTVALAVTNGTLSVSGGTATIAGSGTSSVTLTGTTAQINATLAATVNYVPTANFNGAATLTMTTSDNGNIGSGGTLTDVDTVAITVTAVNDAPALSATTNPAAVVEAANAATQDLAAISGSFAVTDVDVGNTLTASVVGSPTVLLNGASFILPGSASALTAAGAFSLTSPGLSTGTSQSVGYTYDPAAANLDFLRAGQNLTITYAVKVNDGTLDSATQNVTFTLTGSNDAPVLSAITAPASVVELANASAQDIAAINGTLSVSDADVGDTLNALVSGTPTLVWSGGALTASQITTLTTALVSGKLTFGSAVLSDGTAKSIGYTWDPVAANLDFLAQGQTLTVTYGVKVNDGVVDSATQNVTFTITGTNDAPVANADTASTNEDTALTLLPATLLTNDTDADSGTTLSITSVQGAVNGTVALVTGNVVFTPTANYNGPASFTYTISDGQGGTSTAAVNVSVAAVADAPSLVTTSQVFSLNAGGALISTEPGIGQTDLEATLGLSSGRLDTVDPPAGVTPVTTNDPGTVDVFEGKTTTYTLGLGTGQIASFNWGFFNGEDTASEISNGFNDMVVLVVTDPSGAKQYVQLASSEQSGPNTNGTTVDATGTYQFTATATGDYQFAWLILNSRDPNKDSSLSVSAPTITNGSMAYGVAIPVSIGAALVDTDGSESLSIRVSGVPAGAAFSSGSNLGGGIWSFTVAQLDGLNLLPPAGFTGTIDLSVSAIATEASNGATATTTQAITVTIESTTTSTMGTQNADTLNGTTGNDLLQGFGSADVINGNDGNDLLYGDAGNDTLNGGNGKDVLYGGVGNDILIGGKGNDTLIGGLGADTFKWNLVDNGTTASPATDTVKDFDNVNSSDKLDLRGLLVGESHTGNLAGNLSSYLNFTYNSGTNTTTVAVKSSSTLTAPDQIIMLEGVNLVGSFGTQDAIIADLFSRGKLITD